MSDLVVIAGVGSMGSNLGLSPVTIGVGLTSPTDPMGPTGVAVGAAVNLLSSSSMGSAATGAGADVDLGGVSAGVGAGLSAGSTGGASDPGSVGVGVGVGVGTSSSGGSGGTSGAVGVGVGVGVGSTGGGVNSGGGYGGSGTSTGGSNGSGAGTGSASAGGAGSQGTGGGAGSGGVSGSGGADAGGATAGSATTGGLPDTHTAFINIFRLSGAADISNADSARLTTLDQQVSSGTITQTQAILQIGDWAAGNTAVAETSYQFFTGLTPTADGLSYLVHSPNNATDLSDPYYSQFDLENRYINFASNLGLHSDAAPDFAKDFGTLSFQDAVATAYDRIVGDTNAQAAGIDYKAAIADIVSRQPYFQEVAQERFGADNQDLSTKLAAVAYIMEESVRADVGRYGQANQNFLFDLADGKAQFHIDLVGVYGHGAPANVTF